MAVALLVLAHVALLAVFDLARWPWWTFLALAFAFGSYFWAASRAEERVTATGLLLVAAGLRLLLLPLPPTLSDDLLRYVWDGRVTLAGQNPYLLAPEAEELASLRDEMWLDMPHHEVPTVYPPLALALFTAANGLPDPLVSLKILLCLAELLGCWLLIRLAASLELPIGRCAWYCWNPLVTLEVAGMGHVDALLVPFSIAAVWMLVVRPRRPLVAAAAAAAAVLTKLVPLVAVPMWARQSGRTGRFLALAVVLAGGALLPVLLSARGLPPGLVRYGISWEFNGPLYEPLSYLIGEAKTPEAVKALLDELKQLTGRHELWNRFYPYVYPELLAKLILAALFAVFVLHSLRQEHPVTGSGRLFGGLLLCSATLYPWYLLWVLPWAALCRQRAWLGLSALIQLSYLPQITSVEHLPWIFALIWGPFFVLLGRSRWSIG